MNFEDSDTFDHFTVTTAEQEILRDFPELTSDGTKACLAFATCCERNLASSLP